MPYQPSPETIGEQTVADMRVAAIGQALINLDYVYAPKSPVQLPNLPGVNYLGRDLQG
jgi:hypothetical protein